MCPEYEVQRQGWRIACGDKCVLRHDDWQVECIMIDISVSGALVGCDPDFAGSVAPGDECILFLCNDPDICAAEIPCTVTRRDAGHIGLRFPPSISKQ